MQTSALHCSQPQQTLPGHCSSKSSHIPLEVVVPWQLLVLLHNCLSSQVGTGYQAIALCLPEVEVS